MAADEASDGRLILPGPATAFISGTGGKTTLVKLIPRRSAGG
jgi:hypothetical protein